MGKALLFKPPWLQHLYRDGTKFVREPKPGSVIPPGKAIVATPSSLIPPVITVTKPRSVILPVTTMVTKPGSVILPVIRQNHAP